MTHVLPIAILALTAGSIYAVIVHLVIVNDPAHPYTFVWVIAGVCLSLAIAALIVPLTWLAVMLGIFALTGTPQIIGAIYRNMRQRRIDQLDAAAVIRHSLAER
jgi:hypothetical protein